MLLQANDHSFFVQLVCVHMKVKKKNVMVTASRFFNWLQFSCSFSLSLVDHGGIFLPVRMHVYHVVVNPHLCMLTQFRVSVLKSF